MFTAGLMLAGAVLAAPSAGLNETERAIADYARSHSDEAIQLLTRLCDLNSGTLSPPGVRAVGEVFRKELAQLGMETRWIELPKKMKRAGHLVAETKRGDGLRLLLIGHIDTVFEPDDPFQKCKRSGRWLAGPGVYDMKGGDVVILYALKALHAAGALKDTRITVFFSGDEELAGRPVEKSRAALIDLGKRSDAALGFEPGIAKNAVSIARRGSSKWSLRVTAKDGHSSKLGQAKTGYGAIYEMARVLNEVREILPSHEGLTINPGTALGGTDVSDSSTKVSGKNNKISRIAEAHGDLRFLNEADKTKARQAMERIAKASLPNSKSVFTFADAYPAMSPSEANRRLHHELDRASRDLGHGAIDLVDPAKRGAADISFVAPYVPGLAGLGVYGHGAHTREEKTDLSHFSITLERAALLIHRLSKQKRNSGIR